MVSSDTLSFFYIRTLIQFTRDIYPFCFSLYSGFVKRYNKTMKASKIGKINMEALWKKTPLN